MKNTSAGILEFDALRDVVGRYVSSPFGQRELARLEPHGDPGRLEQEHAEAEEALLYLKSASQPGTGTLRISFSGLPEITPAAHKLRMEGAVLDPREVFDVLTVLDRASDIRSNLNAASGRFALLGRRAQSIADFRYVLEELSGKILPDGTVADHASAALSRLRREIERQKKAIHESLERFLKAHSDEGVLQEELVTIRNERFVVPVISGQRRKIEGVIHGASSTGHTLFVEPLATIELNNELVRLAEEEMRECHRIVREMTEKLRAYAAAVMDALRTIAELEVVFAKGRFAQEFDCCRPRFTERLVLKNTRHPLLEDVLRKRWKRVVPFDLELDRSSRTLIISGPNTGGKTVTLKTVGLLALMAHAGVPVPCSAAEFPLFEQVLADIGDNQSIQESLSTFSAHISHIREMVLDATADTLVLLDELGAATDPEEGGALGVAIVDHFHSIGAFTLASTHLLALKLYGANTPDVVNASMGFDESTLDPTYHLAVGVPGKSAGLDIATRLGMPIHLMEKARRSMSDREQDLARFLSDLHQRLASVKGLEEELRKKQVELQVRERELKIQMERRESAKMREMEERLEKVLAKFDAESRDTIEKIRETAEHRKAGDHAQRLAAKAKRELREEFQTTVIATTAGVPAPVPKVEEGARVRLQGIRDLGTVRRKLGADRIEVEVGFMKMQVALGDVLEVLPPAGAPSSKLPRNVSFKPAPELNPAVQELNVIGQNAEEACDQVEEFLDRAVMATASRVRIVHGHGMGILRKAIWKLLEKNPHVERFYAASQHEGGSGATIVEIKE
jgi:DNA mismatch repair protein MutS2